MEGTGEMGGTGAGEPVTEASLNHWVEARTGRDRFRTEVLTRGHRLVADEPALLGGGDAGPTPFDLICAALGSCTTITLRMYADRKGWPLESVVARVEHRRTRREEGGPHDVYVVELDFAGRLDPVQRKRLEEIAGRCPVHRSLAAGAEVVVQASPVADPAGGGDWDSDGRSEG